MEDLDYQIGFEAIAESKSKTIGYPIRQGVVEDWQSMEAFWLSSFYHYLRCDPQEHDVLLVQRAVRTNASVDRAAFECTRESRIHGRDHV